MKKSHDLSILCYIGLVVLFILPLLPPMLRLFGKDLYVQKEEKKRDEVTILTCDKQDENINATFLNGDPQVIEYRIKGDYSVAVSDELENIKEELGDESEKEEVSFIELIRPFATVDYKEENNETSFKVKVSDLKELEEYDSIFNTFDNQQKYFLDQKFSCQKTNYS